MAIFGMSREQAVGPGARVGLRTGSDFDRSSPKWRLPGAVGVLTVCSRVPPSLPRKMGLFFPLGWFWDFLALAVVFFL